jgi:hypothetical protein
MSLDEPLRGFSCCFCTKVIHPEDADLLRLVSIDADSHMQWWFCHASCFKARLDPRMAGVFSLDRSD